MHVYSNLGTLLCISSRHWGPKIRIQWKHSDFLQLRSSSSSQVPMKDNPQHSNSPRSNYIVKKSCLQTSLQSLILPCCCCCCYSTTFSSPQIFPSWSSNLHPKINRADLATSHTTTHLNLVLDSTPNTIALNSKTHGSSFWFQSLHEQLSI